MICNWCHLILKETSNQMVEDNKILRVYECNCLPRFLKPNMIPEGVKSTMIIERDGIVTFYDVYHMIDEIAYNIEGTYDNTKVVALSEATTTVCEMPFYVPTSDNVINELIELSIKIISLKAFT